MKIKHLIANLQKLDPDLDIYAKHGASGVSYEIGTPREYTVRDIDGDGALCDVELGQPVAILYVGN